MSRDRDSKKTEELAKAKELQTKYSKYIDDMKVKVHKITHNKNPKYKTGLQRVADLQLLLDTYTQKLQTPKNEAEKYTARALASYITAQIEYLKSKEPRTKATDKTIKKPNKVEDIASNEG